MILFDFDFCSTLCCCFACFGAAFPISNFLASSDMFGSFPSMNCCQAETRSLNLRWALAGIKDALAMVPSFNPAPKACIFWMIGRFGEDGQRWDRNDVLMYSPSFPLAYLHLCVSDT